jgi:predicted acyl esterase
MERTTMKHSLAALAALLIAAPATAAAAPTTAFDGKVPCAAGENGQTVCSGLAATFDGTTIDVNLVLPAGNGPFPVLGIYHGWGGSKIGVGSLKSWADRGYAAFSMSDRGWGDSCGGLSQTRLTGNCTNGYVHLLDTRYEVRDAQTLIGQLADEGIADPQRIGAAGGSYGGGMSMALAALKDRTMLPDGRLIPWTSPKQGLPMKLAAAAPDIPWTDLSYALQPNGRNLDYLTDNAYGTRVGVPKTTFVAGLFALGAAGANYAPPGYDADADLTKWFGLTNAGDAALIDDNPLTIDVLQELQEHHSSYYIPPTTAPAPLLISNGWTDDLFPADEAIRFYNRTRSAYPDTPISLFFLDYGHQRGQGKAKDTAVLKARQVEWFERYLKGEKHVHPFLGVETLTQTCGPDHGDGPFMADTWDEISPGEVRFTSAAQQPIASPGSPLVGQAFDPISGGGACATADAADQPGVANYRLPAATGDGFTLMGSPTIVADVTALTENVQIAGRLLDVAPDGTETLVARGIYKPDYGTTATQQVWQLHPNGWHFADGHVAKLELLQNDFPYGRFSNLETPVLIENLELRLPVLETPGHGVSVAPAPRIVPEGATLAP